MPVSTSATITSSRVNPDARVTRERSSGRNEAARGNLSRPHEEPPGLGRDRRGLAVGMKLCLPQQPAQWLRQVRQGGQNASVATTRTRIPFDATTRIEV